METFVVRVWRAEPQSAAPDSGEPLRGFVEQVGTGAATRFGGGAELLRFLQGSTQPGDSENVGDPGSPGEGASR